MPPKEAPKKWKAPKGPKPTHRKNKNKLELGRAIKYARQKENAIEYLPDGEMRFTTDKHEANWVKLRSVTQESALDEFLSTAALADKDFTADRHSNVKIIRMDSGNDSATSQGIIFAPNFHVYSALRANQLLEKQKEMGEDYREQDFEDADEEGFDADEKVMEKVKILSIDQLEELFLSKAPNEPLLPPLPGQPPLINIGLVGYPNVGKSSTINSLVGAKKVSVSSTPGKTKHFQTIKLSDSVMLCDCPGLVFPNFAYNKGELVCNGVLPIDQLRDYIGPAGLVAERIPKYYIEAIYGIHIQTKSRDEGGNGDIPTAQELLVAYARARGYMTQGYGSADEPRASRYILKDYVNGKLLYVNPPPHLEDDTPYTREECEEFNKDLYVFDRLPDTRKEQVQNAAKAKGIDIVDLARDLNQLTFSAHTGGDAQKEAKSVTHGGKQAALYNAAEDLDRDFFKMNNVEGRLSTPFHKVQNSSAGKRHNKKNKSKNAKSKVFSIENN
ncbi:BTE_HP_G0108110.mRNA.1.CDS.1 [Saccharomyces cerevisiae]|nr:BTE_HP_G0108110.mRNA.1.CDS.1 [Saccharomyces cerevisiae]CAI6972645.1 BTE_HP_G0108110.mRNA.1.CDS.1 [Saccharomyces cerevisiae]